MATQSRGHGTQEMFRFGPFLLHLTLFHPSARSSRLSCAIPRFSRGYPAFLNFQKEKCDPTFRLPIKIG
jgi:hypothetical protein